MHFSIILAWTHAYPTKTPQCASSLHGLSYFLIPGYCCSLTVITRAGIVIVSGCSTWTLSLRVLFQFITVGPSSENLGMHLFRLVVVNVNDR